MQTNKASFLTDSLVGKFSQKLSFPLISELLILASVFIFWYEDATSTYNLATIMLILALTLADKSKIKFGRSQIYLIIFFVSALFTGVLAVFRGVSPVPIMLGWVLFAQFLVAILAGQGVANPRRLLRNLVFISLPMIAVGGYQFLSRQATSSLWVTPAEASIGTRAFAFFGSPNVLGAILAIIALVATGLYLEHRNKLMAVCAIFSVMVMVFTFSRSAWLGFVAGVVMITLVKRWQLILLAPFGLLTLGFKQIRDRIAVLFTPGYWLDSSFDGRFWSLNNGFNIWAKYSIFGTGPGTYGGKLALNYASPVYMQGIQNGYVALYFTDNQWLQLLVQTGAVGFVLFTLYIVNMFIELSSKYNKNKNWVTLSVTGAFVVFIVTGIFGNVLEFGAIAVPMGVILGAAISEE